MLYTIPDYYHEFSCIAGACPDTCCAGWQIVIDSASMNLDYEHEVQGPFVNPKFPKQVYWKSEATTLTAILYDQDELKEKDILKYLRDIKMEG